MNRRVSETVSHQAHSGSVEDAHGNITDAWATATSVAIYAFNPGSTEESTDNGHVARVITSPSVYVPSSVVWSNRDRVTVRGRLYEVDGDTLAFRSPFDSSENGNQINLKVVSG